jgi:hypothetical protein
MKNPQQIMGNNEVVSVSAREFVPGVPVILKFIEAQVFYRKWYNIYIYSTHFLLYTLFIHLFFKSHENFFPVKKPSK